MATFAAKLRKADSARREALAALKSFVERLENEDDSSETAPTSERVNLPAEIRRQVAVNRPRPVGHVDGISTAEQKVLDALASLEAVGVEMPSKSSWGFRWIPRLGSR